MPPHTELTPAERELARVVLCLVDALDGTKAGAGEHLARNVLRHDYRAALVAAETLSKNLEYLQRQVTETEALLTSLVHGECMLCDQPRAPTRLLCSECEQSPAIAPGLTTVKEALHNTPDANHPRWAQWEGR